MRIGIACDHAGYKTKLGLIEHLSKQKHNVIDFGAHTDASVDYPDFAHPLAEAVENDMVDFGVTLCGSGNGINMTVNKHQGIRAGLCWNVEIARLARFHNDANVCSLPARFISDKEACDIVDMFLNSEFEGGRHVRRVEKIPLNRM
jgi:ribose 5-phosphate isomerase B